MTDDRYLILKRLYETEGSLAYTLAVFGDEIARREGYHEHTDMEAVYFYLVHKFGWSPSQVRGMAYSDIRFVLSEEMSGFVLPEAAR